MLCVVFWSAVVGVPVVFQHTPTAVMLFPPRSRDAPPLTALLEPIGLAATVVRVGALT